MEERLGCVVSSIDQLLEKLNAYLNGEPHVADTRWGRIEAGDESTAMLARDEDIRGAIEQWIARGKLSTLLEWWVKGLTVDWKRLHGEVTPGRVSLPTYPFARERCWIDAAPPAGRPEPAAIEYRSLEAIEEIVNRIDEDTIETERAISELKMLV